ncbi:hypothetical protein ARMGADRAFT_1036025 [Armillaria gallica]|uniref:Uncharacterized protein n=1 Tax=Armillaria gallica TaxID=47427 RepID=A0A2H3D363_ARMGA|nr:hypothetical protein ARMGADRAFT_1036025 [Armillaria gallica]
MSTNTFSSTATLSEYFAKLPKCKADGTNWIFFRDCFLFAINAVGLSDHFEDVVTATELTAPAVVDPKNPTADETKVLNKYAKKRQIWKSEFIILEGQGQGNSENDAGEEGGDVKTHLTKLQSICEDLIMMGADPDDNNFVTIVLGSLPTSFETYFSALTGILTLLGKALNPDMVLQGISNEGADRRSGQQGRARRKPHSTVGTAERSQGNWWSAITATGGGKEGQGPRKGCGQANSSKIDKDFDAVWFTEEEDNEEDFLDLPSLQDVSDSEDKDSNDEADELDISTPELLGEITSLTSGNLAAAVADTEHEHKVDIFNSGTTQHMTPSHHWLMNYMAIET